MNPYSVNRGSKRRVVVLFEVDEIERLDQIGVGARMPSRSETIRTIIKEALKQEGAVETAISPRQIHD